jgi:DNA polymerase III subunit delta
MPPPEPLRPAYLIYGSDRPKVRRAVARLRARVIEEAGSDLNVSLFDAEADPPQAVLEAAATPGLTLGTRLLLVVNAHKWKAAQRSALAAYLADPAPDTCLAVEAEKSSKDDALAKAIAKAGAVLAYDLPRKHELAAWVRERARALGLTMNSAVARALLDLCGEEPEHVERLEREIEKLAAYCGTHEATVADVQAICTPAVDAKVFALMDAVGARDRARAFGLLETLFASSDARENANSVFYSLKRHVQLLADAGQLGEVEASEAARQLGVHPFTARKLLEQRRRYDRRTLGRALAALADAETHMRGRTLATLETSAGVNYGDQLAVELALARLLA